MSTNIVRSLNNRELNIRHNPKKFLSANYFNESMVNRMTAEYQLCHEIDAWDQIICGSWNSTGNLLGCGKPRKGVQVFKPFRNFEETVVPVQNNCYLTDALFMPKHENLLIVSSRNHSNYISSSFNGLEMDECVKVWNIETKTVYRKYCFRGLVEKLTTSEALPNHIWFNIDQTTLKIAEADLRAPSYNTLQLNVLQKHPDFLYSRNFDVNPVDEVTIAVGDHNQLVFYDRRMMSTLFVNHPTKTVDTSSLNGYNSYISQLTYSPNGEKLLLTKISSFNIFQYIAPAIGTSVENMRRLTLKSQMVMNTFKKSPKFLGQNYVLFDLFFKNCSIVFNLEDTRYVGKINISIHNSHFSNISIPHPYYCLIASTNESMINFITPTSFDEN